MVEVIRRTVIKSNSVIVNVIKGDCDINNSISMT